MIAAIVMVDKLPSATVQNTNLIILPLHNISEDARVFKRSMSESMQLSHKFYRRSEAAADQGQAS